MAPPDVEGAITYALGRLSRELSPALTYHSLQHTRDDVAPAAVRLARDSGLHGEPLDLLRTAAYFHDLGFVVQSRNHELIGAQMAAEALPAFGYSPQQIQRVVGMVLATRLPQSPQDLLEELMADADLDILGREDFLRRNQDLRDELANFGHPMSDAEWFAGQLRFLSAHRYWSAAARSLRDQGKARNSEALAGLFAAGVQ